MKKTLLMGLFLIIFTYGSSNAEKGNSGGTKDKNAFTKHLSDTQLTGSNDTTVIDNETRNPTEILSVSTGIPMHKRSMSGKEVIDIFKVTETQLLADPVSAQRFYRELQELKSKKNGSYKTQVKTKEQVDKWLDWLLINGFVDTDADIDVDSKSGNIPQAT